MTKILVLLPAVCLAGVATGCQTAGGTKLSGAEKDADLAFREAKSDNLMAGLQAGDDAVFSKDFDTDMPTAMSPDQFKILKRDRDARLGPYVSRKVKDVYQRDDFYTVIDETVFEADNAVIMRVVFRAVEPQEVSGLWFDK